MKTNIQILTKTNYDYLLTFKSINPEFKYRYDEKTYDPSCLDFLNIQTDYYINDKIELEVGDSSNRSTADLNSSIKIFKELKNITPVQANDKRLWAALTHKKFYRYTKDRWGTNSKSSDDTIISRFFFEGASIETRMRNSISRLWWAAKLTHDDSRDDEFELTKLLWSNQDLFMNMMERSFGTYENVVKAFLEIYAENKHLDEKSLRNIYKSLNSIGGVKLLSAMSYDDLVLQIRKIATYKNIQIHA